MSRVQLSCRVHPQLKQKLKDVYGNYSIIETLIDEHLQELANPIPIVTTNELKENLEESIEFLQQQQTDLLKQLENIEHKIEDQQNKLDLIIAQNDYALQKMEDFKTTDLKMVKGSVHMVEKKLTENKNLREKIGCYPPVKRSTLQPYARVAGISLDKLLEFVNDDLLDCIE